MIGPPVPPVAPPPERRARVTFNAAAHRAGTVLTVLMLVIGGALTLTGTLVAPLGAPFLTLGALGLLVIGLEAIVDRRRMPRSIPLDPDTLRRSHRP